MREPCTPQLPPCPALNVPCPHGIAHLRHVRPHQITRLASTEACHGSYMLRPYMMVVPLMRAFSYLREPPHHPTPRQAESQIAPRQTTPHTPDADRSCPDAMLGQEGGRARRVVHQDPPVHDVHFGAAAAPSSRRSRCQLLAGAQSRTVRQAGKTQQRG